MVRQRFHTQITIFSPSMREERFLGFDDSIHGLPSGRNLVLQFKKPESYQSSKFDNFVRFLIDTRQLQLLLDKFRRGEAFYVFVALNTFREIILNRQNLLNHCVCCDVHDIPNGRKISQKTRVARMGKTFLAPPPQLKIADPRRFEDIRNLISLEELCGQALLGDKGMSNERLAEEVGTREGRIYIGKLLNWKHTYFVHIQSDSGVSMLWPDS